MILKYFYPGHLWNSGPGVYNNSSTLEFPAEPCNEMKRSTSFISSVIGFINVAD